MSENKNWANRGEQILDSVTDALNTGDFNGLNNLVAETVTSALQEARNQALQEKLRRRERVKRQYTDWQQFRSEQEHWDRARREQSIRDAKNAREAKMAQSAGVAGAPEAPGRLASMVRSVKFKKVGSVSSVLYTVFGSIGIGGASLGLLISFFLALFGGGNFIITIMWLGLGLIALVLLLLGIGQRARLNRSQRYIQICGQKMYGMIEDFAKQIGKSVRYVRKDLRKMLELGFFPEGHLDDQATCFMLNDEVYQQYAQTAAAYREAAQPDTGGGEPQSAADREAARRQAQDAELNAMIAEGMEHTRKLRELNDNIPGEPISNKLYQLEDLLNEIFDRVREHPEQMHRMHKMMDYYLPTTLKLVSAYEEFSNVSAPGEDIISAMAEIEKTLDIINQAFKELLNELFQDDALDITTDAQVLQTMLAREGLTREMDPFARTGAEPEPAAAVAMELEKR